MENVWFVASAWMGLALLASVISIRLGISVALVEMFIGVIGGNFLGFHTTPWIDFLATFGSGLLTFLAGAEIDPASLRKHLTPSLVIGGVSFLFPFLGAMAFAYYVMGWTLHAAQIAGIALSTTLVAVVYAVMVETGLSQTDCGSRLGYCADPDCPNLVPARAHARGCTHVTADGGRRGRAARNLWWEPQLTSGCREYLGRQFEQRSSCACNMT
jgi:hypothetical protein